MTTMNEHERLAQIEVRVEEQGGRLIGISQQVRDLDQKVDQFRTELSGRIDGLDQKLDRRIDALDQKVDRFRGELSNRIEALDQKFDGRFHALDQKLDRHVTTLSGRIDVMDQKIDRFRGELSGEVGAVRQQMTNQFKWLVGINVTMWAATVAAIFVSMSILLTRLS